MKKHHIIILISVLMMYSCNNKKASNLENAMFFPYTVKQIDIKTNKYYCEMLERVKPKLLSEFKESDAKLLTKHPSAEKMFYDRYDEFINNKKHLIWFEHDLGIFKYTIIQILWNDVNHNSIIIESPSMNDFIYLNTDYYRYVDKFNSSTDENLKCWDFDSLFIFYDTSSVDVKYFQCIIDSEKNKKISLFQNYELFSYLFYKVYDISFGTLGFDLEFNPQINKDILRSLEIKKEDKSISVQNINIVYNQMHEIEKNNNMVSYYLVKDFGLIILVFDYKSCRLKKYFVPATVCYRNNIV